MIKNKYLFFILVLISAGACSTEETISPIGKDLRPVILGEANPADSISVKIFMIQNSASPNISSVIPMKAEVRILDETGKTVTMLHRKDSVFWHASTHLNPGESYTLDILTNDNKHIKAQTFIPESFHAFIESKSLTKDNRQSISLRIADKNMPGYFVIECVQELDAQTQKRYLFIDSQDTQTDNYIYNELPTPTQHLFLHKKEEQQVIRLNIPVEDNCFLQIRKVDPVYYKYLYTYEVQNSNDNIPGLLTINPHFLGVWGGCNMFSISLSQ